MKKTLLAALAYLALAGGATAQPIASPVVDTGQTACYDATTGIACPAVGKPFFGQDAQFSLSLIHI